ncbi:uncharacterized protein TNIN_436731 [Trichonephila inaurata madagascariensis]|uniref:Uncharacterized protein n=1 Tax=Trichonephila inaurata madagascariensis TaxID=2747483 RepID=A0A8X7C7B1_9ARAC|nr:uncharacterized protein TNIN_436731 [Trichonephila inaurata madagascariensis]
MIEVPSYKDEVRRKPQSSFSLCLSIIILKMSFKCCVVFLLFCILSSVLLTEAGTIHSSLGSGETNRGWKPGGKRGLDCLQLQSEALFTILEVVKSFKEASETNREQEKSLSYAGLLKIPAPLKVSQYFFISFTLSKNTLPVKYWQQKDADRFDMPALLPIYHHYIEISRKTWPNSKEKKNHSFPRFANLFLQLQLKTATLLYS